MLTRTGHRCLDFQHPHVPHRPVAPPAAEEHMAKSKSKETSLPLIISLVFFVLTTVGLGIFCYVLYSDMETKDAEVAKKTKEVSDIRGQLKDAELVARVDRAYFGVEKDDDLSTI